jgi:Secretion system C-terminal sorting domain
MWYSTTDSGTVNLLVINKTNTVDSAYWSVQETSSLRFHMESFLYSGPTITIDTFTIVESKHGNHRLYRTGDPNQIYTSVLPFYSSFIDSQSVYRYAIVDTAGIITLYAFLGRDYYFHFKQGVGLTAVHMDDGCTCLTSYYTNHSLLSSVITGIDKLQNDIPLKNSCLNQNYPDPFNPSTTISFTIPTRSSVLLKIYDMLGKEVTSIVSAELPAGTYSRQWNASKMSSGIYFYRLQAGSFTQTKRLVLLK